MLNSVCCISFHANSAAGRRDQFARPSNGATKPAPSNSPLAAAKRSSVVRSSRAGHLIIRQQLGSNKPASERASWRAKKSGLELCVRRGGPSARCNGGFLPPPPRASQPAGRPLLVGRLAREPRAPASRAASQSGSVQAAKWPSAVRGRPASGWRLAAGGSRMRLSRRAIAGTQRKAAAEKQVSGRRVSRPGN